MGANPSASAERRTRRSGRAGRFAAVTGVAGATALLLSGCSTEEVLRFGWPKGITPQAEQMEDLWTGSVIAALAVGVFVWGLIFWAVIRYRKKSDELPVQTRFNLPIEILYTAVPFLIIAVLFYYTAIVQTFVDKQKANPDLTVSVVAFKWNWQFLYPELQDKEKQPIGTIGSTTEIPVLVVPTGERIRFMETSDDVIHSFWVPALLFKRDVVPGRTNSFEATINKGEEGAYVGRCAELCGTYHANMNFELRAVTSEKFDQFIAAKQNGASTYDALESIGESPIATTTTPFNPDRTSRQPS
ncbi:cytochrome c oxidase subunit II [Cryptosporangium aurantiacum]|uniref:Cytochrome c oxidase subunit 2 n=1 Tax=Cryptosporangium aurantiacum TaxID=134849 RepID=A0A1M7R8F3_9ACTN|nr:cytochrome c oxidase subunit II [Cryptosporangium aurantiacum]SHN42298.1 cytochrome c oxidase subunit 2 [Cryptosporangium aurantiacum]